MKFLSFYFRLLDLIAPSFAARQAYHFMSNPRVRKLRSFEEEILSQAVHETLTFRQFDIQAYKWGNPDHPLVFLIHGWEGQAGNFGALIELLLDKGYAIIAFDGPSHGKSTKAPIGMFEYADFVTEMLNTYRPKHVLSHSFGSVATIFSLSRNPDIHIDHWFLITTPNNFKDRIKGVQEALGITERTVSRLIRLIESDTEYKVDELNMATMGSKLQNVRQITIVHSRSDRVLPIEDARNTHAAIPNAQLVELDGLGHYGILWSAELKEILTDRLAAATSSGSQPVSG